jgi:methionine sulfoxide reductase heme-binding subunit
MSGLLGSSADWYLMRGSGFVALILITLTAGLGIANVARLAKGGWTRMVAALVHRNVSLLAVVFLGVHVLTAISDRYVKVPSLAILVPGASGYDPLWVGLGALSVDLLIAVVVTSLIRARLRPRSWRLVHWLAYLAWPSAILHGIGAGSGSGADTGRTWSTAIYVVCALTFAIAVVLRLSLGERGQTTAPPPAERPRPRYRPPAQPTRPARPAGPAGAGPVRPELVSAGPVTRRVPVAPPRPHPSFPPQTWPRRQP